MPRTCVIAASALASRMMRGALEADACGDPVPWGGPPVSVPMASPCANADMSATIIVAKRMGRSRPLPSLPELCCNGYSLESARRGSTRDRLLSQVTERLRYGSGVCVRRRRCPRADSPACTSTQVALRPGDITTATEKAAPASTNRP
jgi:hypothetical protein